VISHRGKSEQLCKKAGSPGPVSLCAIHRAKTPIQTNVLTDETQAKMNYHDPHLADQPPAGRALHVSCSAAGPRQDEYEEQRFWGVSVALRVVIPPSLLSQNMTFIGQMVTPCPKPTSSANVCASPARTRSRKEPMAIHRMGWAVISRH